MRRRTFLKTAGAGIAAGLAVGLSGRRSLAAWGDPDPSVWGGHGTPATKVLEIHLLGGMAPWESFYYRPIADGTRGFDTDLDASHLKWNASCAGTPNGLASQSLGVDAAGNPVNLGPFAAPLWRQDIISKTRVVVLQHDLQPHEAAIPYALSGRRLGRPGACGLGAPLQRRAHELDPTRAMPASYCLVPPIFLGSSLFSMLDAVGSHPGAARPVVLPVGATTTSFLASLTRTVPAAADPLIQQYDVQYGRRLFVTNATDRTRSAAYADFDSSTGGLQSAASLSTFLNGGPLVPANRPQCSSVTTTFDISDGFRTAAMQSAAYLLNHPTAANRARYVCIVDGPFNPSGFLSYDLHHGAAPNGQAQLTSTHLWETLSGLASIIRQPTDPRSRSTCHCRPACRCSRPPPGCWD
ncbi:MAG TPA: hypothetical protein VHE33_18785 [Acidobacteriaceae bacterium]|nr:hypothetical protein [Acidobacteriaceae bacterium]